MEQEDKSKSFDEQGQETADRCAGSSAIEGNGQDAGLNEDAAGDAYMSELGDIGNVDPPDIDLGLLDFLPSDEMEETRYMLPHAVHYDPETFVLYDNAEKLARELRITDNMRADAFIAGSFIFGDFIEAFMTVNHAVTPKMTISTLSMSQENVDSLHNLMEAGFIKELNLIISVYFWAHERNGLLPYIYEELDMGDRFQLSVAGMHTKTCHFKTIGGKKICIHGSANLRSSGSIEELIIEENPGLYDFFEEQMGKIVEKYKTINKPIRNSNAWDLFTRKYFKD